MAANGTEESASQAVELLHVVVELFHLDELPVAEAARKLVVQTLSLVPVRLISLRFFRQARAVLRCQMTSSRFDSSKQFPATSAPEQIRPDCLDGIHLRQVSLVTVEASRVGHLDDGEGRRWPEDSFFIFEAGRGCRLVALGFLRLIHGRRRLGIPFLRWLPLLRCPQPHQLIVQPVLDGVEEIQNFDVIVVAVVDDDNFVSLAALGLSWLINFG